MPYVARNPDNTIYGRWATQQWEGQEYLPDDHPDLAPSAEQLATDARAKRDRLLSATDWTQIPDAPLTADQKAAYAAYRQALRDVPQQAGFPRVIEWPVVP